MNKDIEYRKHVPNEKLNNMYFGLGMLLARVKSYYRGSNKVLRRPNMLITLLHTLKINILNSDIEDVYEKIMSDSIYVSNHVGIVSNLSKGNILHGVVIPNMNEVFMYVTNYDKYDIQDINIMGVNTIRTISTTLDSLLLCHPTNIRYVNNLEDITIYEIDVNMLALQYYTWARDEMYLDNDIDISRFLYTVVLVNMMDSLLNVSLLNRYMNTMDDSVKDIDNDKVYNPIQVLKINKKIDKQIQHLVKNTHKKQTKITYDYFLKSMLLLDSDGYEVLQFTNRIYTSNNEWVYWLSRVGYMERIIELCTKSSLSANKLYTTNIRTDSRILFRSKALEKIPDKVYKLEIEEKIRKILKMV